MVILPLKTRTSLGRVLHMLKLVKLKKCFSWRLVINKTSYFYHNSKNKVVKQLVGKWTKQGRDWTENLDFLVVFCFLFHFGLTTNIQIFLIWDFLIFFSKMLEFFKLAGIIALLVQWEIIQRGREGELLRHKTWLFASFPSLPRNKHESVTSLSSRRKHTVI